MSSKASEDTMTAIGRAIMRWQDATALFDEEVGARLGLSLRQIAQLGPWRVRQKRWAQVDSSGAHFADCHRYVGRAMSLAQRRQHVVVQRLDRARDEQATAGSQLGQKPPGLEQVLDLDGRVEGDLRPACVQLAGDPQGMRRAVQEVGIAERHMARAGGDLLLDVAQHRLARDGDEAAAIHRHDRTMPAQVLAPARRLDGGDEALLSTYVQTGVMLEHR